MDKNVFKEAALLKIIHKPITKVIAGGSIGSIITLVIGDDEYDVVVYCVWRLEDEDKILTGWNESNDSLNGNLKKNIKELHGDVIHSFEISNFFDLKIQASCKSWLTFLHLQLQREIDRFKIGVHNPCAIQVGMYKFLLSNY